MKLFATTIAAALFATSALATGPKTPPPFQGGSSEATLAAQLTALGFSSADARSMAAAGANATGGSANNRVTVSSANTAEGGAGGTAISAAQGGAGGRARSDQSQAQRQGQTATGGYANAQQTQGSVTGSQAARTGDVIVDASQHEENPTNAAYAPGVAAGSNYTCDRFFGISFGGNGETRSISGGIGVPYEAETCGIAYTVEILATIDAGKCAINATAATMPRAVDAGVVFNAQTCQLEVSRN